jgi:hypothetical protein
VACLHIWYLFYKFGIPAGDRLSWAKAEYRTANIAPHSAQTEAVFKAIHQIMTSSFAIKTPDKKLVTNKCLLQWYYLKQKTINTPPYKQYFANNSYIEHRSLGADQGDSLQGKPYGLITYDEGGRSHHLKEEVMGNIIPRLGDWVAPFHILSTPDQNSPSILYHYELYQNGNKRIKGTYSQEGALSENILFGEEQIKEQYALFEDDPMAQQVLDGKFIFGGNNIFNIDSIQAAQLEELDAGERYIEGHKYVMGIDTAIGSDEFVASVIDVTEKPYRLVRMMAAKGNSKSPQQHMLDLLDLFDHYNQGRSIHVLLETWNGESARFYMDMPPYMQTVTQCYGSWQPEKRRTDNRNQERPKNQSIKKADILVALSKLLNAGDLKIFKNDPNKHHDGALTDQQLSIYKEDDGNLPTDRVISLSLAAWLAQESKTTNEIRFIDM